MLEFAKDNPMASFREKLSSPKWQMLLLKLPKLLGLAKATKGLVMMVSMIGSILAYGFATNSWTFGFGIVGLLFVHEMGHVWAAARCGVKASWPIFIPFLGAAILVPKFRTMRSESFVAMAGPLVGTVGALALLIPYAITGERLWIGLLYLGLTLNAFNMIPLRPLDGGRMTAICGTKFRAVGLVMLAVLSVLIREPVILYVWVLVLVDIPLPAWWRSYLAIALGAAMMVLMALGLSNQPWFADIADSICVSIACCVYWHAERQVSLGLRDPLIEEAFEDEAAITSQERTAWTLYWLGGCAALGILLWLAHGWLS